MLTQALVALAVSNNLANSETEAVARCVYRYALHLTNAQALKAVAAECQIVRPLLEFKKDILDSTEYCLSSLWRAVYAYYLHTCACKTCCNKRGCIGIAPDVVECTGFQCTITSIARAYGVAVQDLNYIIDNQIVTSEDLPTLESRKDRLQYQISKARIEETLLNFHKTITYRVYKHLAFIYTYQNLDPQDFVVEIETAVLKVLLANDYVQDQDQLNIIANRIIRQEICNIISMYTAQKRTRLLAHRDGYQATTLSLDACVEDTALNLYNLTFSEPAPENVQCSETTQVLLKKIKVQTTPVERLYINIKTGKYVPKALLRHVVRQTGKPLEAISEQLANKTVLAYLGWSSKDERNLKRKIQTILGI